MNLKHFVLNFCFFSEPKSFLDPEPDKNIKVFSHHDINNRLEVSDTFHFNRGEPNFFSQYGNASYAFWTHSFYLEKEEIENSHANYDIVVERLFKKLKEYLLKMNITPVQIKSLKETYDCRCEILLTVPSTSQNLMFKVKSADLQILTDFGLDFSYWPLKENQINQLKNS